MLPAIVSLTNTSILLFVSFGTRLEAKEENTTYLPSGVIENPLRNALFDCVPAELTFTLVVIQAVVSLRKRSACQFVSFETKLFAADWNSTYFQSGVIIA